MALGGLPDHICLVCFGSISITLKHLPRYFCQNHFYALKLTDESSAAAVHYLKSKSDTKTTSRLLRAGT